MDFDLWTNALNPSLKGSHKTKPNSEKTGIYQRGRRWEKVNEGQGHETLPDNQGDMSYITRAAMLYIQKSQTEQAFGSHHKERTTCHLNGDHFSGRKS